MNTSFSSSSRPLVDRLAAVGFSRVGSASFASGRYRLQLGKPWSTIQVRRANQKIDPLADQLGTPGPWKRIRDGEKCRLIADVPLEAFRDHVDSDAEDDHCQLAQLFDWLRQTSFGGSLDTWQPPELEEIETWYGPEKLTVVVGSYVCQGTLERGPGRLAVRVPIVPLIPPELAESRMNWLRAVLIDTQNRHRAARIGLVGEASRQSVVAEIDLSGAPSGALEALFTNSLIALKNAVQFSIQSAGFLVDPNVECRALAVRPHPSV